MLLFYVTKRCLLHLKTPVDSKPVSKIHKDVTFTYCPNTSGLNVYYAHLQNLNSFGYYVSMLFCVEYVCVCRS